MSATLPKHKTAERVFCSVWIHRIVTCPFKRFILLFIIMCRCACLHAGMWKWVKMPEEARGFRSPVFAVKITSWQMTGTQQNWKSISALNHWAICALLAPSLYFLKLIFPECQWVFLIDRNKQMNKQMNEQPTNYERILKLVHTRSSTDSLLSYLLRSAYFACLHYRTFIRHKISPYL